MPELSSEIDIHVNITLLNWKQSQTRALEFSTWVLLKMGIRVSSVSFSWFALLQEEKIPLLEVIFLAIYISKNIRLCKGDFEGPQARVMICI